MPRDKKRTGADAGLNAVQPSKRRKKERAPRCRGKVHFYTWPRCPLSPESALKHLVDIGDVEHYLIAREEHKEDDELDVDAEPYHLHAYVRYKKTKQIPYTTLHLKSEDGTIYKGNYQTCRNANQVAKYCAKDGQYITSYTKEQLQKMIADAADKPTFADVIKLAQSGDPKGAFTTLVTVAPRDVLMRGPAALKSSLRQLDQTPNEERRSDWEFTEHPRVANWDRSKYSLVVVGKSGLGKTSYAKSLFKSPCVVTRIDGLKEYSQEKHDGLVFDDMCFEKHAPETQLHLTGVEDEPQLNVKFGTVTIPRGTPRVFVRNYFPFSLPIRAELRRRIHCCAVKTDLRVMSKKQTEEAVKPEDDLDAIFEMTPPPASGDGGFFFPKNE